MVRQIIITVPHEKAQGIRNVLQTQNIVHHLDVYKGETSSMIICKVVNKKTDEILQLLARYSVGIGFGHIDVVPLSSTKPRIATFRGTKPKHQRWMVSDRMSYDEMLEQIDSGIHLTFDYLALIAVGALICASGLLTNSAVNVVASMLVSPLMGPIVGMTFGTIVKDKKMFMLSFRNECLGLAVCWGCGLSMGFVVGTFFDVESEDGPMFKGTEMGSRGTLEGLAWGAATAIPSGLGVALGVSSYTISALIGVAISAALLPPIVNCGVCLGASLVMLCRPDVGNDDIMLHWVETGLISFCLFLANWIILYLSAMAMFRMKKLHQHARTEKKAEKLAQFSKMVDDVEDMPYLELPREENIAPFHNYKTQPVPNKGNIGSLDDSLMSQASLGGAGGAGQFDASRDMTTSPASAENLRTTRSQSRKIPFRKRSASERSPMNQENAALLQTGSLRETSVSRTQQMKDLSSTSLRQTSSERLVQSAETKAQGSKKQEKELLREPLMLSD